MGPQTKPRDRSQKLTSSNWSIDRRSYLKVAGAGGITGLAGCTSSLGGGGTTTLRIIHSLYEQEVEMYDILKEQYKEDHEVEFEAARVEWSNVPQEIAQASSAGNPFDIIVVGSTSLPQAVSNGIVQPITDVIDDLGGSDHFVESNLLPIDGEQYLAPIDAVPFNYIYRQDFTEQYDAPEPPYTNWDDLLTAAERMTIPDQNLYGHPVFTQTYFPGAWAASLLLGNGGHIFNENKEVVFDSPEVVETFELIQQLDQYSPDSAHNSDIGGQRPPLYQGNYAMTWYSRNLVAYDIEEYNPDLYGDVQIAPFPSAEGHDPVCRNTTKGWTIASDTENREEAASFIKFMLSQESMMQWMQGFVTTSVPSVKGIIDRDEFWEHERLQRYEEIYRTLNEINQKYGRFIAIEEVPGVNNPNTGRALQGLYVTDCIQDVIINGMEPQAAVEKWAGNMRDEFE